MTAYNAVQEVSTVASHQMTVHTHASCRYKLAIDVFADGQPMTEVL